jgi:hypothetical protein
LPASCPLIEGNGLRPTERLTGVHPEAIIWTLARLGNACPAFPDDTVRELTQEIL